MENRDPRNKGTPGDPGARGSDWIEISVDIHPVAREVLSAFLFDLGCSGVVSENFDSHDLKAYFPPQEEPERLRRRIEAYIDELTGIFPEARSAKLTVTWVENQDWSTSWRQFFRPQRIADRLMVLPAWYELPQDFQGEVIRMDPGPAFGTGQHPTTRMCLEAMGGLALPRSWTMLDVGTGSGILAIYGARLGAAKIVGIDTDPEALPWAEKNIDLNGLTGSVEISSRPLETLTGTFSLITANLTLETILMLLPDLRRLLESGGVLILSGLLGEQVRRVQEDLSNLGLHQAGLRSMEEWACIVARRREG